MSCQVLVTVSWINNRNRASTDSPSEQRSCRFRGIVIGLDMVEDKSTVIKKTAFGAAWLTGFQLTRQLLQVVSVSVLARRVPPAAYRASRHGHSGDDASRNHA